MNMHLIGIFAILLVSKLGVAQRIPEKQPEIFTRAEVDPMYSQGYDGWIQYLAKHLNNDLAFKNGAPESIYRVSLEFIVETDGSITGIKATNQTGYGMEEEAVRVLKESGKWRPASQNKFIVRCYKKETIVFSRTNAYKTYLEHYPIANHIIDSASLLLPGIFTQPDRSAVFSPDYRSWLKYLQKELRADIPYDNGAPK